MASGREPGGNEREPLVAIPSEAFEQAQLADPPAELASAVESQIPELLSQLEFESYPMTRASLVKSDFLMRTLGRPNRDQIVSMRPNELTTLEAIDLANGQALSRCWPRGPNDWPRHLGTVPRN